MCILEATELSPTYASFTSTFASHRLLLAPIS
jgi:hypothetical protein